MQITGTERDKYIKYVVGNTSNSSNAEDDEGCAELGWVMKEYEDNNGNSVSLIGLEKGQTFNFNSNGTRWQEAIQDCYAVSYRFNHIGNTIVFTPDSLEEAIDMTLKFIALARA